MRRGSTFSCGLVIDRQRIASRNIWNEFLRDMGTHGFASKGAKPDEASDDPEEAKGSEAQWISNDSIHINT